MPTLLIGLETFLSGMETKRPPTGAVPCAPPLKPSLVEWKRTMAIAMPAQIALLETFLSGMETFDEHVAAELWGQP